MSVSGRRKRELSSARRRHTPDQVIAKLTETDAAIAAGSAVAAARPPDWRDRADLLPLAQRVRGSRDRPGKAPKAPEVGEQPPDASRGGPGAGQPDPEGGVWGILLGPSRRRRCVESAYNPPMRQPARGRDDAPTSCPDHIGLEQSCLLLWRRNSICFVL